MLGDDDETEPEYDCPQCGRSFHSHARLDEHLAERVLPITEDIMLKWWLAVEEGRKKGHTFSQPDLIIAVTAIHHGLTVVTRDRNDYDQAEVHVIIRGTHGNV